MAEGMFIPDMVEEDEAGIAAKHPNRFTLPLLIAPTHPDNPDALNTLRHSLITVACKKVPPEHFIFDSSFVAPGARDGFRQLHGVITRHPNCPMAIWGHADPDGQPLYNKWLSERRAEAVYAVLIRDVDAWERLCSSPGARGAATGDVWGDAAIRTILDHFGFPYDEEQKETLKDAIKRYQSSRGETNPPGKNDAAFRKKLFAEYMDAICCDKDGTPYSVPPTAFLGEGKEHGPFQGCSEFNLQMILAKEEAKMYEQDKQFGKELRHDANRDNRRVMVFFFAEGTRIEQKGWPCPRAKQGIDKCVKHLWSDHKQRLEQRYPLRRRRFGKQVRNETERMSRPEMTFGCRFYHALALRSPCERDLQMYAIQLLVDAPKEKGKDGGNLFLPVGNVRFVARLGEGTQSAVVRGRTTPNGMIGIPFLGPPTTIKLKVDIFGIALGGIPMETSSASGGAVSAGTAPASASSTTSGTAGPTAGPSGNGSGALAGPSGNGASGNGASSVAGDEDLTPKEQHADTDRFDDEDDFFEYVLGPDKLFRLKKRDVPEGESPLEPDADEPEVNPETELEPGARQRLYNLGYGSGVAEAWTPAQRKRYLIRFQRDQRLTETGELDPPTVDALHREHGS